jgi:hypothetical protein
MRRSKCDKDRVWTTGCAACGSRAGSTRLAGITSVARTAGGRVTHVCLSDGKWGCLCGCLFGCLCGCRSAHADS